MHDTTCGVCAHDNSADGNYCARCGAPLRSVEIISPLTSTAAPSDAAGDDRASVPPMVRFLAGLGLLAAVVAIGAVVLFGGDEPESTPETAPAEAPEIAAPATPTPGPTAAVVRAADPQAGARGPSGLNGDVLASLDLGSEILALRTDKTVELIDLETGAFLAVAEIERSSGGEVWFLENEIVMRSQGRDGPGLSVLNLDTAAYRIYGSFNFIVSDVTGTTVLGQEFGELYGGGRWAQVELSGFAIWRLDLALSGAYPFPVAVDAGVVANQGSQVVLYPFEQDPTVLGRGEIVAWSSDAVLIGDCDADLECSYTSIDATIENAGTVIAAGPAIELPELSLGGETRYLSPDGRYLAVLEPNIRELQIIDVETGGGIAHDLGRTSSQSIVWTSNSRGIVLADGETVAVVSVPTGATEVLTLAKRIDQVGLLGS